MYASSAVNAAKSHEAIAHKDGREEVKAETKGPRGHGECHELWHTVPVKTGATAPESPSESGPFTVFAWLWAAGIISHMASYSEPVELVTIAMFVLALAVVFGVYKTPAFFTLVAVHVIYVYNRLPRVPNHSVIAAAVDLTILGCRPVVGHLRTRTWRIDAKALYKIVRAGRADRSC